jgi:hypothetical protein
MLGNAAFGIEFLSMLSPVDYVPRAFEILDKIHQRDPARFKTYANLAIAIALVYDVPPPPTWPHGQVSAGALPRQFPDPLEAFGWWIKQEQRGRTYHRLSRLGATELKFVVDTVVPFAELEWAQGAADLPLAQLARGYTMVRYRNDRISNQQMTWSGQSYTLQEILASGGICSDQAFFASQVGKSARRADAVHLRRRQRWAACVVWFPGRRTEMAAGCGAIRRAALRHRLRS